MKALQYIEIDLDHCANTYSVLPCRATLTGSPPTGTKKCFNTPATCQDRANYIDAPITMRFAVPTDYLPASIDAIPNIKEISFSPGQVSLGQNLGQRSALTITFEDHRHSDTGTGGDPYLSDRSYNPFTQGTFLAKFRARNRFLSGRSLRWIIGEVGQTLGQMETRHYVIDSYEGPNNNGEYTITAKDVLRLADDQKALAPITSLGVLGADITNVATSLTLTPVGSGEDYPSTGFASIGGSEIVAFTHQGGYIGDSPGGSPGAFRSGGTSIAAHNGGLSGAANGKQGVFSIWIKPETINSTCIFDINNNVLGTSASTRFDVEFDSAGLLRVVGKNTTPTTILDFKSSVAPAVGSWTHIVFSFDLTNTSKRHCYINGVNALGTVTTYTNDNVAFSAAGTCAVAAFADSSSHALAAYAQVFFDDSYIDLSVPANLAKFVVLDDNGNPRPVNYGANGSVPLGVQPVIFLEGSSAAAFITNLGTGGSFSYIGGSFTQVTMADGDGLTLTARGQLGTTAAAHSANDRVQVILRYINQDPAVIIADLLENYAGIDPSFIPLSDWLTETSAYSGRLYTATIALPTGVNTLISELIEQAGLIFWWDDIDQEIGLAVIRGAISGGQEFNQDNTIADSLQITDQPDKRLSQVTTYFAQINPLTSLTDKNNFRSVITTTDADAESDYGSVALKEIYSRWIPLNGGASATAINNLLLARFRNPPRHFKFQQLRGVTEIPQLARTYNLAGWPLQTDEGAADLVQVQITRVKPLADLIEIEGDELLFDGADANTRTVSLDVSSNNINARTAHDLLFAAPVSGNIVNIIVNSGVVIGSATEGGRALDIGSWPAGVTVNLTVLGRIQGCGGQGGDDAGGAAQPGHTGGTALYTRQAITLTDAAGQIWGGGGGGGGGQGQAPGGGGGAGTLGGLGGVGFGANNGLPGTDTAGGAGQAAPGGGGGFPSGGGGGPGLAGSSGGGAGGAAGVAIDGISFVTTSGSAGDRRGGQVN